VAVLPLGRTAAILSCFQQGRTTQWARAHFFVAREIRKAREAGVVPPDDGGKAVRLAATRLTATAMDLDKIREAAERVARSEGLDIFDIEWLVGKQRLLRVYLDRNPTEASPQGGGITHQDCERVSQQLNVILDVEDLVPGPSYVLEVSSPGLDRKLIKPADYARFSGRLAKIWLNEPVENSKYFEGRLAGISDGNVKLSVRDRELNLPFAGIRKANLVVEI
jgi:ribosome maturation factor RimP